MLEIICKGNYAQCSHVERLTSGTTGLKCKFTFDETWNGLAKTAVFVAGNEQRDVLLNSDICVVPWEVLKKAGYPLTVGVYGRNADGMQVIPTIYANCGSIVSGADPCGDEGEDPTPTLVEQIMTAAGVAVTTANAIKASAEAGEFNGEQGPQGERGPKGDSPNVSVSAEPIEADIYHPNGGTEVTIHSTNPDGSGSLVFFNVYNGNNGARGDKGDTPSLDGYATEDYVKEYHDKIKQDRVTVVNDLYPEYVIASVTGRSPHDCTFIGNDFVSFNKPEDGGDICYFNPSTWGKIVTKRHSFTESTGKGLQMKSVDYKYSKLLVGNGRAIASDETSYTDQGAKLYVFHEAEGWKNASTTITFSNCGDYDVIDVSALGYKAYGFWGGSDGLVFVSCNLLNDVYLIQLESANGRYNGNYSVINHWHQDGYFRDFAAHGGQMYNGSLYLAINDDSKCDVLKCILCDDGSLKFDVLHFGKKSGNTLDYHYIDGVCIKDGKLYAQPLYKGTNYSDVYSDVIVAKIDNVGAVYPNGGIAGQVLTKTASGEEWQTPRSGGGGGGMETILDITLTAETDHIHVTTDADGNPLSLDELHFDAYVVPTASNTAEAALSIRTNFNTAAKGGTNSSLTRVFRTSGAKQFVGGTLYANACINGSLFGTQSDRAFPYVSTDVFDTPLTALYLYGGVFGVGSRIVVKGHKM